MTEAHKTTEVRRSKAAEQQSGYTRLLGWIQLILVIAVLGLAGVVNRILSSAQSTPDTNVVSDAILYVDTIVPEIRDVPVKVRESGVVRARNTVNLSPQVSGRVVAISPNLASGGFFKAGETLFRLDKSDLEGMLDRAKADVASAQANLEVERAESNIAVSEWNLVNPGEPVPDLVARTPQISQAVANLQSARATESQARLDLSRVDFSLPFDGRVLSTTIEIGQNLSVGQSYGSVYNADEIEVSVPIPQRSIDALAPVVGRKSFVQVSNESGAGAHRYTAAISREDAELDTETRLSRVTLSFTEPPTLLPGEFVDVEIEGPLVRDAHIIPAAAFAESGLIWVASEGRLSARRPRIFYAEDQRIIAEPFDFADGVVTTLLVDPISGTPVQTTPSDRKR
ncbi:MAG: efflux RND transporter periplasmic adaptor subunit [Pseudomonadota bacterium]